jgi:hypothetical protein
MKEWVEAWIDLFKTFLEAIRGHRTHLANFIVVIGLLIRIMMLPDDTFIEALKTDVIFWMLAGSAGLLSASKIGSAIQDKMKTRGVEPPSEPPVQSE